MNTEFKERLLLALKIRREAVLNGVREEDAPFQKGFKEGLEAAEVIIRALRDPPLIDMIGKRQSQTAQSRSLEIVRRERLALGGGKMAEFETKPYAPWLESTFREMVDIDPVSIAMEMVDANGQLYTCYWNTSRDDRTQMISAMQDDDLLDLIRNNKDVINEILSGEEVDENGLCEPDTETDSEG